MQPSTESKPKSTMPLLPAEIILAICSCIFVEPHNPLKGFNVIPSVRDNIRTLRQLSLTCRGIHSVVTPALYGSIYFTSPKTDPRYPIPTDHQSLGAESLVYFLRTILEHPNLCKYVKDLTCLVDLKHNYNSNEKMKTPNKDYGLLSAVENCEEFGTQSLLNMGDRWLRLKANGRLGFDTAFGMGSRRPLISTSHAVFALILCLLPNITSISLRAAVRYDSAPLWGRVDDSNYAGTTEMSDSGRIQHSPLQNLRTLQLQCELLDPDHWDLHDNYHVLDLFPVLRNAPNLMRIRSYGYITSWGYIPDSVTSLESWGIAADFFLNSDTSLRLKSVVLHLDCTWSLDEEHQFDPELFGHCLSLEAPALEHLEVLSSSRMSRRCISKYLPRGLLGLNRLQHLALDTRFFSGEHCDEMTRQIAGGSPSVLPPNIKILRLVDSEPRRDADCTLQFLGIIIRAHVRKECMSKLRSVEYFHMPPLTDVNISGGNCSLPELVEALEKELALDGVQFHLHLFNHDEDDFLGADLMGMGNLPV